MNNSDRTYNITQKIKQIFGGSIPALDRLVDLNNSIWKLEVLKGIEVKYKQKVFYKERTIFGYSKKVLEDLQVSISDEMSDKIIDLFQEEYEKWAKECECLISKFEK